MKWFENIIFEMSAPAEHVIMIDAGTEFILKKAKKVCRTSRFPPFCGSGVFNIPDIFTPIRR